jgi:cell division septum initiation protein DivIVA
MNPQQVRTATFKNVRKGWDPSEVGTFLGSVAESLEAAQNQATAMEARARAAVARLQEVTAKADEAAEPSEEISRALILAQRTADLTVAEAHAEAERILAAAREEAGSTIDSTREMSATMLEEARAEARRTADEQRRDAQAHVADLEARRDALAAEVERIEAIIDDQRTRLRLASATMLELADAGFGTSKVVQAAPEPVVFDQDPTIAIERPVEVPAVLSGDSPVDLPVRGASDDEAFDVTAEEPLRLPVADTL